MISNGIVCNGAFDCFHGGHFRFIHWCWKFYAFPQGLPLIVGIDSDNKVKKDKGQSRPYFSAKERKLHLLETGFVDDVFVFDSNEELNDTIKKLNPVILIKGIQWKGNVVGEEHADEVVFYQASNVSISTTEIESRIERKFLSSKTR